MLKAAKTALEAASVEAVTAGAGFTPPLSTCAATYDHTAGQAHPEVTPSGRPTGTAADVGTLGS